MKSQVIFGSQPTEHEKRALKELLDMFPAENHVVIFGPLVPTGTGSDREMDVVLICPRGIFNIEMKNWKGGVIREPLHNMHDKVLVEFAAGRTELFSNPVVQASKQSRILKHQLQRQVRGQRLPFVQAVALFTVGKGEIEYTLDPLRTSVPVHTMDTVKAVWSTGDVVLKPMEIEHIVKSFNIKPVTLDGNVQQQKIGNYTIQRQVFKRDQYTVYHAVDQFGLNVFLKVHKVDQILLNDEAQLEIEMSKRDAVITARLGSNPHVLRYHNYFQYGDYMVLVMDYVDHVPLARRMKDNLPLAEKLAMLKTIFNAIRTFHRVGVYHRDLHPNNIVFAADGQIKFLNFDFSRVLGERTVQFALKADSLYIAPEVNIAERDEDADVDHHTDYYSYGFIAYELLAGRKPYEEAYGTSHPDLRILVPEIDEQLAFSIEQLIKSNQAERDLGWEFLVDLWDEQP